MTKKELIETICDMPDDAQVFINDGFDFEPFYNSSHNESLEDCICDKDNNVIILTHWL